MQFNSTSSPTQLRLIDLLGSGSNGTVFRAEHRTNRTAATHMVAVKVPKSGVSLEREAQALKQFSHSNIIELVEDKTPDDGSLVIELCTGGTVEDQLHERAMSPNEVRNMVTAIAKALGHIHQAGWIHGDVNPSNIGLRRGGPPALIDFGTCRPADGQAPITGTEEFSGTKINSTAMLDIRSLAATALGALGAPTSVDHLTESIHARLGDFIRRCDAGEELTLNALAAEFDSAPPLTDNATPPTDQPDHAARSASSAQTIFPDAPATTPPPDEPDDLPGRSGRADRAGQQRATSGGNGGPRTRIFGPRPGGSGEPEAEAPVSPKRPLTRVAAVAAVLLLLSLVGVEAFENQSVAATQTQSVMVDRMPAEETLAAVNAQWSGIDATVRITGDGTETTFQAGQRGDRAAIGDWDCDGIESLGVFRPATGEWFTFDSWSPNAVSHNEQLTDADATRVDLLVEIDSSGCARPVLLNR